MSINAISPIDGRYQNKTVKLSEYFSEKALIKYRIISEIKYLQHLSKKFDNVVRKFTHYEIELLNNLSSITDEDAEIVKQIETKGYKNIKATNHDVKAIEYFIKLKIEETSLADVMEIVHFALTSEDINNLSYAMMMKDGFNRVLFPELVTLYIDIYKIAFNYKNQSMLARTHGQPASPTTFGKELLVFVSRMKEELKSFFNLTLQTKLNGATGNYNAHFVTFPDNDWCSFSRELISILNEKSNDNVPKYCSTLPLTLELNQVTTQIEPHDSYGRIFDGIKRINTILIDFCQDIWRYISDGWIKQKPVDGEIGSSAMPHKVNPIDFENAEGNLGIANSLLIFFTGKLSVSRLQRDLSDSTVLRNVGVAFAHSLIAYQSILKGLSKIDVNSDVMNIALQNTPEVIAEAYQNILRVKGVEKPYELLKEITRGKKVTLEDFYQLVEKLDIDAETKKRLLSINPVNYTGLAAKIVEDFDPNIC